MAARRGHKKAGGRVKGTPNKVTSTLKAALQKHEKVLVAALLKLTKSDDENVRLKAIQACLDRGWGKPVQPHTDADGENILFSFVMNLASTK